MRINACVGAMCVCVCLLEVARLAMCVPDLQSQGKSPYLEKLHEGQEVCSIARCVKIYNLKGNPFTLRNFMRAKICNFRFAHAYVQRDLFVGLPKHRPDAQPQGTGSTLGCYVSCRSCWPLSGIQFSLDHCWPLIGIQLAPCNFLEPRWCSIARSMRTQTFPKAHWS